MERVRGVAELKRPIERPVVVTIGNFDGVHLGHRRIIEIAVSKAKALGGKSVAYTFRPHPRVALSSDARIPLILTYDEKLELLGSLGIDLVIEEPFTRSFSTTTAEKFFTDTLVHRLSAEAIVVGYDFTFGKERKGHLEALESLCKKSGVELTVVPPQRVDGEVASSSRIRQHLLAGDVAAAAQLLGRPFFYRSDVIKGEGRGRKIGFPTANLRLENKLTLPYGVYATCAKVGGRSYPSVTNVGVRPTFQAEGATELPALIETHLIGQTIDLYGSALEVSFLTRLRDERKFPGIDALIAQIKLDCEAAARFLDNNCHRSQN